MRQQPCHRKLCDFQQVSQPLCVLDMELEEQTAYGKLLTLYLSQIQLFLEYCLGFATAAKRGVSLAYQSIYGARFLFAPDHDGGQRKGETGP